MSAGGSSAHASAASTTGAATDTGAVTLADVEAAAQRLHGQVLDTPFLVSQTLSQICGCEIHLKFENQQFTASFKERGALNRLLRLREGDAPVAGVVAASAGNHAQGLAHHAQRLGIAATIVMPRATPQVKVDRTRGFGARVVLHGESFDAAREHAVALGEREGLTFVHPFDDADIVAGQGTIALEMLRPGGPALDALVVQVGGGGLLAGIATAARALQPGLSIIGVQTLRFASMVNAIQGRSHPIGASTIAEGIAVGVPGRLTRALIERHVDDLLVVDEGDIEQAVLMLLEIEKTVAEGAGAAGLAAVLRQRERFAGRRVGLVLSGGNIDPMLLQALIGRGMVRAGRLARIRVQAPDAPGVLARLTAIVADAGANIDEVHHQRMFTSGAAQTVEVELVLQTRNVEHGDEVVARIAASGMQASRG